MIAACVLPFLTTFTMPPTDFDLRRLVLVRTPSASDVGAVCAHVTETHGADVRYMMAESTADGIGLLDLLVESIQPKTLGALATSQTTALCGREHAEALGEAGSRAVQTRDYVLGGTVDGGTSLLVAHESIIELLLMRAADLETDFDSLQNSDHSSIPAVSVLDFGPGAYPWMVAVDAPRIQPQWYLDM